MIRTQTNAPILALALFAVVVGLAACSGDGGSDGATDAATGDSASDAGGAAGHPSLAYDLTKSGPFAVGYRTLPHTYTAPGGRGKRTITLHIWYPASEAKGDTPMYAGLFADPDAHTDAPLAPPDDPGGYPVLVHSHGHQGFGGNSAFLMRALASHGWVAVAPDHVGNLLSDYKPPKPTWLFFTRASDISAALDALADLPDGDPLKGKCKTDKVVMSGHSFGVHTCWAVAGATFDMGLIEAGCKTTDNPMPEGQCTADELAVYKAGVRDARVVASIPMAGSIDRNMFGPKGHESVAIPMLAMSGGEDPVGADKQFASCDSVDLTWIDLAGACHQSFGHGGCGTLDKSEAFPALGTWARAFARRHVLGDTSAQTLGVLDGSVVVSSKFSVKHTTEHTKKTKEAGQ